MGLVLICPECQAKVALQAQVCPYCQADLRHVPQDRRRYAVGQPGPSAPPAAPETVTAAIPVLESAGLPEAAPTVVTAQKIRRPHVRRYAAPPVSQTHPGTVSAPKENESKAEGKKAKKPKATPKKKK